MGSGIGTKSHGRLDDRENTGINSQDGTILRATSVFQRFLAAYNSSFPDILPYQ